MGYDVLSRNMSTLPQSNGKVKIIKKWIIGGSVVDKDRMKFGVEQEVINKVNKSVRGMHDRESRIRIVSIN